RLQPCLLKIYSNMVVLWGNYEGIPQRLVPLISKSIKAATEKRNVAESKGETSLLIAFITLKLLDQKKIATTTPHQIDKCLDIDLPDKN
ncbi:MULTISPECIES: hypothetical protein, partial [Vibrio]